MCVEHTGIAAGELGVKLVVDWRGGGVAAAFAEKCKEKPEEGEEDESTSTDADADSYLGACGEP